LTSLYRVTFCGDEFKTSRVWSRMRRLTLYRKVKVVRVKVKCWGDERHTERPEESMRRERERERGELECKFLGSLADCLGKGHLKDSRLYQ